ncbi:phospholipase D-like domain-containing protein [Marilutibacter alkalisoli]|uniref:phospholipase D-like domain-containing protein n=1 Tax=Marilutibacter alkalisoli TaxID=2591633 RepID=UPI0014209FEE|nr:phospholipase D-like domain-containing protein [Lysobacter alkalisoli]
MTWTVVLTAVLTVAAVVVWMNFATPEKALERKIAHHYTVSDTQFAREMSVLLGPSILPGNHVEALNNGVEIFPAMLEAIASAKETITFETYVYWSGDVGTHFADALAERAKAGVEVRVMIDWVGSARMDATLLEQMETAGVWIVRYRPLRWYNLGRLNNRTHRKLLVIDGRVGFTGGVGIADPWQGNAESDEHWRDMHFRIEGPAVAQMQAAFNDNWIKTTGLVLNGEGYFPPLSPVGNMSAHVFIASPAGGSESMHLMYLMSIAAAEHSIDLAAAYFVPDELAIQALLAACARGVKIRLIVPGKHVDSEVVRVASRAHWGELLIAGAEVHEYQPAMFHIKMLIVDGEMVSIGSTNFDLRSFRLNDEASLNVYDAEFARRMTRIFEADLRESTPYTFEDWANRPWRQKAMETVVLPLRSQL